MSINIDDIRRQAGPVQGLIRAAIVALPFIHDPKVNQLVEDSLKPFLHTATLGWDIHDILDYEVGPETTAASLGMTEEDAQAALDGMIHRHDADYGITWDHSSVSIWRHENGK